MLRVPRLTTLTRAVSTVAATATADGAVSQAATGPATNAYNYARARHAYRAEIKTLRKQYAEETNQRVKLQAQDVAATRAKIEKEKAARNVVKQQKHAKRVAEVARKQAVQDEMTRKLFEEKVHVREARHADVARRHEAMLRVLQEEAATWITTENMDTMMDDSHFANMSIKPYQYKREYGTGSMDVQSSDMKTWLENLQHMVPGDYQAQEEASDNSEMADDDVDDIPITAEEDADRNTDGDANN